MPNPIRDLTGMTKGRLTALRDTGRRTKWGAAIWVFRCACDGKEIEAIGGSFVSGVTKSCGCLHHEHIAALNSRQRGEGHPNFTHGHGTSGKTSPTWRSWKAMRQRVMDSHHVEFKYYGGAPVPIQICEGLREFIGFLAVLGERPSQHTLGRFGDVGHYSCGQCEQCQQNRWELNCEWETKQQQANEQKIKRARITRQAEDQVLDEIFAAPHAA